MNNNIRFYFFTEKLNEFTIKNILKFKNLCIIYKPTITNNISHIEILNIKKFCKQNKILFYISDNLKLAYKYGSDGIFLSCFNKKILNLVNYKKNFCIIGSAHNINEYFFKVKQKCQTIMLSPIFYNKKYTINKILGITKFNLITLTWKTKICALGGLSLINLKKIKATRSSSIGFVSLLSSYSKKSLPTFTVDRLFKTKLL